MPTYLRDRGAGVATSMFGTYVRPGELVVYPFFERYVDNNLEYKPEEFGYPGDLDVLGRYRASEGLLFVAYGLRPNLAVEFEAAVIEASLDRSAQDRSGLPSRIRESGLGDVEGQVRWRWRTESDRRPELFSYVEAVVPHHAEKPLIGTAGWELKLGTGVTRGFSWGTLTARAAVEYAEASTSKFDLVNTPWNTCDESPPASGSTWAWKARRTRCRSSPKGSGTWPAGRSSASTADSV